MHRESHYRLDLIIIFQSFNHNQVESDFEMFFKNIMTIETLTQSAKRRKISWKQNWETLSKPIRKWTQKNNGRTSTKRRHYNFQNKTKKEVLWYLPNRNKYDQKFLEFLNTEQFKSTTCDITKTIEGKLQGTLRKMKKHILKLATYSKLYPTGSCITY